MGRVYIPVLPIIIPKIFMILKEVSCSWHVRNVFNNFHSGTDLSYLDVNLGRGHQAATLKLKPKLP